MAIQPTYPGVYIEEIPSGVRTITGVSTSIAAFIDYFKRGPMNKAVQIFNFGDFERYFGGLDEKSEASYAIDQFFMNGGNRAYVIRVAGGVPAHSTVEISDTIAGGGVLKIRAISEGTWGENIGIRIEHTASDQMFNILITEYNDNNLPLRQERYLNLSMSSIEPILNDENTGSKIIRIEESLDSNIPASNGTFSGEHTDNINIGGKLLQVTINGITAKATLENLSEKMSIKDVALPLENAIRSAGPSQKEFSAARVKVVGNRLHILAGGYKPDVLVTFGKEESDTLAADLLLLPDADENKKITVNLQEYRLGKKYFDSIPFPVEWVKDTPYKSGNFVIRSKKIYVCIEENNDSTFKDTKWKNLTTINDWKKETDYNSGAFVKESGKTFVCLTDHKSVSDPQTFVNDKDKWEEVKKLPFALNSAQIEGTSGNDGGPPDAKAIIGNLNEKKGLYALEDVDLFNILCLPRTAIVSGDGAIKETEAETVMTSAIEYCEQKRAFFIMDTPNNIRELPDIQSWIDSKATLRSDYAALYFPRLNIADPLNGYRVRSFGASGTMAGLYARTDADRGVWKAPAGTDTNLRNVTELTYKLTDSENGVLNPIAVNCLRTFPIYGNISWGGRTLAGADAMASEWKYIPVRRLALFIEESLFRGTQWVVFEPNDEALWAQIRLNVGAFMNDLFRKGAFQGTTAKDAYHVQCDSETTTQNDRDLGIVNVVVGFAPLKPAEFVIIKIKQLAGQILA